jgi:hypothetical protein
MKVTWGMTGPADGQLITSALQPPFGRQNHKLGGLPVITNTPL